MFLTVSISLFFSLVSLLCFLSDALFGKIYFKEITPSCFLLILIWTFHSMKWWFPAKAVSKRKAVFFGFLFLLIFAYFIVPALPDFFPLQLSTDGANNVALMNRLHVLESHRVLFDARYNLSPEKAHLFAYPWGMHAVVVGLSKIIHVAPVFLIYPFLCLVTALTLMSLVSFLMSRLSSPYATALTLGMLLVPPYGVVNGLCWYWTQLMVMPLCLSLIYFLNRSSRENPPILELALLAAGIFMIYPLFSIPCILGMTGAMVQNRYPLRNILLVFLLPLLIGTTYFFLHGYHRLFFTVFSKIGLLGPMDIQAASTTVFLCLPAAVYLVFWKKDSSAIFALVTMGLAAGVLFCRVAGLIQLHGYWIVKILSFNLFLLAPVLGWGITWLETVLKSRMNRMGLILIRILLVFGLIGIYPQKSLWAVRPAFTREEYQLAQSILTEMPDKRMFYIDSGTLETALKHLWFKAIFPELRLAFYPDALEIFFKPLQYMRATDLIVTPWDLRPSDERIRVERYKNTRFYLTTLKDI